MVLHKRVYREEISRLRFEEGEFEEGEEAVRYLSKARSLGFLKRLVWGLFAKLLQRGSGANNCCIEFWRSLLLVSILSSLKV